MPLSDAACRSAKPSDKIRKLSDGGGLQLCVMPNGSKLWWVAYRYGGKAKSLSLGKYPLVSLADARLGRDEAKKLLAKGVDPSDAKKKAKAELAIAGSTFRAVADEYVERQRQNERAAATLKKLEWVLEFSYPAIGNTVISKIRTPEVLEVIRKVEQRGHFETARRLRSTIGAIFRFAIATGRAEVDPTNALRGALATPPPKHRAAIIEPKAFGALLRAIDGFEGQPQTLAALKLMALLFPRPGELRFSEWQEFNLESGIWTIPAGHTKMRRAHSIPLSRQARDILLGLHSITGNGRLAFPSIRTSRSPMSENTMNAALRRMGYGVDEMSSHGFRSSASTLLNESGLWNSDAIERQLAHVENNEIRRAYARGEYWEERVKMMQWWADHLEGLKVGGRRPA